MESNSRSREGTTLIEIVISMALLAIISISVYGAYMLLIKQTKGGQVKQTSTLIGKQISEEIKSTLENKEIGNKSSSFELNNINFVKDGNDYKGTQYFNEKGNLGSEKDRYKALVVLEPKTTENGTSVVIDKSSNVENSNIDIYDLYIVGEGGHAKVVNQRPDKYSYIEDDKTIKIEVSEQNGLTVSKVATESNDLKYTLHKKNIQINMDLKSCIGFTTIEVDNETELPLNLCVLNNNNVKVENKKGILNEYYRSEVGSKTGTLYSVNVNITDQRSDNPDKSIFETNFVQNINFK
ncbi:PulJ/GspJ family protein [Clostridium beijerinckii]|uniref:Prepilin-type N-terminal cleavage/methylation domain-containing protein n=1 Tax=Clostridium beijerinckii TaxID=1520 RepID=A0A7X9SK31_CLOBE|nr:prepilin-type N-terminal cleavage/methylation domain-containing protein [Clostridium beijerinckii]NMF03352.1 prepilin-type N-terminal cleavage/methylation domain-containing protein [Clostridium beijerinckii]